MLVGLESSRFNIMYVKRPSLDNCKRSFQALLLRACATVEHLRMASQGDLGCFAEGDILYDETLGAWGYKAPITRVPTPPEYIMNDTLKLKAHIRVSKVRRKVLVYYLSSTLANSLWVSAR